MNTPIIQKPKKIKKIAVSGTAGMGKTTLIRDMVSVFDNFASPKQTYRDYVVENNISLNKEGGEESQRLIRDFIDAQISYNYHSNPAFQDTTVVFDRCLWDNLIYTIWLKEKKPDAISDDFLIETIKICQESLRHLDIVFWVPYDSSIPLVEDGLRDANPEYVQEIDNLFSRCYDSYFEDDGLFRFYNPDDRPAIIPLFGSREQRIAQIGEIISLDGYLKSSING